MSSMERFAAKKIQILEERKKALEKKRVIPAVYSLSTVKQNELNKFFGYPEPPTIIYALGRSGSAAVWWHYDNDSDIIEWEVHRYRKDLSGDTWKHKGSITVKFLKKIKQIIFEGLSNGREYRFSVKTRNKQGYSQESVYSNPVMVEADLPFGWRRVLNESTQQFVYSNSNLNQTLTSRPDIDPYFLEEYVAEIFDSKEIHHLKELYDEEVLHFGKVTILRYKEILYEVGEKMERRDIQFIFRHYLNDELEITTYQKFMDITAYIKKEKKEGRIFNTDIKSKEKRIQKKLVRKKDFSVGNWLVTWHPLAERWQYVNMECETEVLWCIPNQVKFYLTPSEWDKLHNTFDFGMVERIKLQFEAINRSRSGYVDETEFNAFLDAVDAGGDVITRQLFFRSVDKNRNGCVQFSEFAMLMCKLAKRKPKTGMLHKLESFGLLQEIAQNGPVFPLEASTNSQNRDPHGKYRTGDKDEVASIEEIIVKPSSILDKIFKSNTFYCLFRPTKAKIAAMSSRILEFTALQQRVGPHGRYCMCGCRNLDIIDEIIEE